MNKYIFYLIAVLGIVFITQPVLAQSQIDDQKLQELIHFSDSTGASKAMVIYNSEVLESFQASDCDSIYMNTASMVKSWTGLAVGVLIDKGLVKSEDDEICHYIPEWTSGCENNVTIKHLLTMSSGLERIRPATKSILAQDDMNEFALNQKVTKKPGTLFSYSNEGAQLLGILIENVSSQSANTFFQENIFTPLGMDSTKLWQDKSGNDIVYGGAKTTIHDAAKIGLLMLNDGYFQGQKIISNSWIKKSTTISEVADYYGFLWWGTAKDGNSHMESYTAMGDFGQMTVVFPEKDLIYIREQSCKDENIPNMSWMSASFIELIGSVIQN